MSKLQTALGTPIVFKSGTTFEIIKFGDLSMKIAGGFRVMSEVGDWVRARGGTMGARGNHPFIGEYREIYLPGWEDEQETQALEEQMWEKYQAGQAIESVGQDCPFCPPGEHDQYKIKAGCFVKGVPSCQWCAYTEEISQAHRGPATVVQEYDPTGWWRYS